MSSKSLVPRVAILQEAGLVIAPNEELAVGIPLEVEVSRKWHILDELYYTTLHLRCTWPSSRRRLGCRIGCGGSRCRRPASRCCRRTRGMSHLSINQAQRRRNTTPGQHRALACPWRFWRQPPPRRRPRSPCRRSRGRVRGRRSHSTSQGRCGGGRSRRT